MHGRFSIIGSTCPGSPKSTPMVGINKQIQYYRHWCWIVR